MQEAFHTLRVRGCQSPVPSWCEDFWCGSGYVVVPEGSRLRCLCAPNSRVEFLSHDVVEFLEHLDAYTVSLERGLRLPRLQSVTL